MPILSLFLMSKWYSTLHGLYFLLPFVSQQVSCRAHPLASVNGNKMNMSVQVLLIHCDTLIMFPMDIHTCTSSINGFYDRGVCDCMRVCGLHTISHGRLTVGGLFIFHIFTINFDLVFFWYKHS